MFPYLKKPATCGDDHSSNTACPELIFAFVGAVGVDLTIAESAIAYHLGAFHYTLKSIKITRHILPELNPEAAEDLQPSFVRIGKMMDFGTSQRILHGPDILAKGVAKKINQYRTTQNYTSRTAFLILSLKHPEEVRKLREIYPRNFYLIGVHAHPLVRLNHLTSIRKMSREQADQLMLRDKKEDEANGQQVNDTFHLADFFVGWGGDDDQARNIQGSFAGFENSEANENMRHKKRVHASTGRFVDIVFGHPHITPTFGEYAMFLAFTSSLRSADLSRQVGAVIAKAGEIISTGANDCPCPGGGLYWPHFNPKSGDITDVARGRDSKRGGDSNRMEQDNLITRIIDDWNKSKVVVSELRPKNLDVPVAQALQKVLHGSPIRNLTEYGRVVHAEMEAILACARKGESTQGATIYCTTFPCHNCAKHIIAAGIQRVVFVEPYLKSKAFEFYDDSMVISYPQSEDLNVASLSPSATFSTSGSDDGDNSVISNFIPNYLSKHRKNLECDKRVKFEPFFGVGPRRFFDLFSMSLSVGRKIDRKHLDGSAVTWVRGDQAPRLAVPLNTYSDREARAALEFDQICLG